MERYSVYWVIMEQVIIDNNTNQRVEIPNNLWKYKKYLIFTIYTNENAIIEFYGDDNNELISIVFGNGNGYNITTCYNDDNMQYIILYNNQQIVFCRSYVFSSRHRIFWLYWDMSRLLMGNG